MGIMFKELDEVINKPNKIKTGFFFLEVTRLCIVIIFFHFLPDRRFRVSNPSANLDIVPLSYQRFKNNIKKTFLSKYIE